MLDNSELLEKIKNTRFSWHSPIDFGNGVVVNKHSQRRFARRLKLLQIPADLTGKTVLDIGAWDGFFSFEFERRGAKRVLAIDTYAWDKGGIDCFLLAKEQLKSKVEHQRLDVHDLCPDLVGTFDYVFCAGVLYHLRNPFYALEKIFKVTKGTLICETHAMIPAMHEKYPLSAFFPGDESAGRWDVCGYTTLSWLENAVKYAGFARSEFKYTPSMHWYRKMKAFVTNRPQSGRVVIHAHVNP